MSKPRPLDDMCPLIGYIVVTEQIEAELINLHPVLWGENSPQANVFGHNLFLRNDMLSKSLFIVSV